MSKKKRSKKDFLTEGIFTVSYMRVYSVLVVRV